MAPHPEGDTGSPPPHGTKVKYLAGFLAGSRELNLSEAMLAEVVSLLPRTMVVSYRTPPGVSIQGVLDSRTIETFMRQWQMLVVATGYNATRIARKGELPRSSVYDLLAADRTKPPAVRGQLVAILLICGIGVLDANSIKAHLDRLTFSAKHGPLLMSAPRSTEEPAAQPVPETSAAAEDRASLAAKAISARFGAELIALRETAGNPPVRAMAGTGGIGHSSISRTMKNPSVLPTWRATEGFVRGCGDHENLERWRSRWLEAKHQITALTSPMTPPPPPNPQTFENVEPKNVEPEPVEPEPESVEPEPESVEPEPVEREPENVEPEPENVEPEPENVEPEPENVEVVEAAVSTSLEGETEVLASGAERTEGPSRARLKIALAAALALVLVAVMVVGTQKWLLAPQDQRSPGDRGASDEPGRTDPAFTTSGTSTPVSSSPVSPAPGQAQDGAVGQRPISSTSASPAPAPEGGGPGGPPVIRYIPLDQVPTDTPDVNHFAKSQDVGFLIGGIDRGPATVQYSVCTGTPKVLIFTVPPTATGFRAGIGQASGPGLNPVGPFTLTVTARAFSDTGAQIAQDTVVIDHNDYDTLDLNLPPGAATKLELTNSAKAEPAICASKPTPDRRTSEGMYFGWIGAAFTERA